MRALLCCLSLFAIGVSSPLVAQQSASEAPGGETGTIVASDLDPKQLQEGGTLSVVGKYKERIDEELYLFDCSVPFLLANRKLSRDVLEFTPTQDNLKLAGTVVSHYGEPAVRIHELTRGPDDEWIFRQALERIRSGSQPKQARLVALAKRLAVHQSRHTDPKVATLTREVLEEAYVATVKENPSDPAPHVAFVREVDEVFKSRQITTLFLLQVATRFETDSAVKELVKQFRCRKYRGRWVTYEGFKQAEGLVFHRNGWMLPAEQDLLVALENFLRKGKSSLLLLRKRTEREYEIMAASGRTEPGMNRREVHAALGFPDHVRRRSSQGKEFDQWSYDDEYYYFFNGILVQIPASGEEQEPAPPGPPKAPR